MAVQGGDTLIWKLIDRQVVVQPETIRGTPTRTPKRGIVTEKGNVSVNAPGRVTWRAQL